MHRIGLLAIGILFASSAFAEQSLAKSLYTVRTWTLQDGATFSGRFESIRDETVVLAVSGSPKEIPFASLSYADQVFLRDALANTTQPLTLPLASPPPVTAQSTVVAPPVVAPPPVTPIDSEPKRTYYRPPEEKPKQVNYGQTTAVMIGEGILLLLIVAGVYKIIYH